jgi:two-component system phosphate regulon sensor histidine kinase PhoR
LLLLDMAPHLRHHKQNNAQSPAVVLGLAIVKHIINRHRGRLVIESEPGTGTTVRAILPELARADEVEPHLRNNRSEPQ